MGSLRGHTTGWAIITRQGSLAGPRTMDAQGRVVESGICGIYLGEKLAKALVLSPAESVVKVRVMLDG